MPLLLPLKKICKCCCGRCAFTVIVGVFTLFRYLLSQECFHILVSTMPSHLSLLVNSQLHVLPLSLLSPFMYPLPHFYVVRSSFPIQRGMFAAV